MVGETATMDSSLPYGIVAKHNHQPFVCFSTVNGQAYSSVGLKHDTAVCTGGDKRISSDDLCCKQRCTSPQPPGVFARQPTALKRFRVLEKIHCHVCCFFRYYSSRASK